MRILITGSSGLVGSALVPALQARGDDVLRLVRRPPRDAAEIPWDIAAGRLDHAALEGLDAVVHLAGSNIAAGRWTKRRRREILESRTKGTRLLCESLARCAAPPAVLVSASGINIYGNRGDTTLTEESIPGEGFLTDVVRAWESATEAAFQRGIRVVKLRLAMVLSPKGGALAKLLLPFRLGLGGPIGSGRQYLSWIAIDDLVRVLMRAIDDTALSGPVNASAPEPVTNADFAAALGRVLHRPSALRVPAFILRAMFGRMAEETLLSSARAIPSRLDAAGFAFAHPELESALRSLLGRPEAHAGA